MTAPRSRDWAEAAGMLVLLALAATGVSLWSEALQFDSSLPGLSGDPLSFLALAAVAVIVPSLAEELIFRGALQPARIHSWRALAGSGLSLAAFIVWHPVQVWTGWFTGQAVFLMPEFLAMAGLLGLACTISVHRSGSLSPAVAMHWVVVVAWKAGTSGSPS
ncbi:MAG: CPBP family glutamic-type intramembrane protease [Alphaproteobacteria bacterium]|nr:CPBP family glutamic-type intramembrane protease [Alphaproteobacteria bacterium]